MAASSAVEPSRSTRVYGPALHAGMSGVEWASDEAGFSAARLTWLACFQDVMAWVRQV